jgi:hypothetical protein
MKLRRSAKASQDRGEIELPERADPVTIVRPSGERVQARVAERDSGGLLVALMFRAERPFTPGSLDQLVLEFTNHRGRIRLQGTVTLEDRELLRFRELHSVELIQQREYVRIQSTRPVLVVTGGKGGTVQTYSVDISGGGMLLAGPSTLKVGEQVEFRLTTAKGSPPVAGVGTVVGGAPPTSRDGARSASTRSARASTGAWCASSSTASAPNGAAAWRAVTVVAGKDLHMLPSRDGQDRNPQSKCGGRRGR